MIVKFAVKEYLEDCEYKNLSAYTVTTYKRILADFERFCGESGISTVDQINKRTIREFMTHCRDDLGNVPSTINLKLRVLKAFVNYLIGEDLYDADIKPFRKIGFAKVDSRIETFNDKHLRQILRYYERESRNKPYHAYRNRTMVLTFISTGIRRGELANLRWSDIDFENSMILVFGKRRREDGIPITAKMRKELADFYTYCKSFFDGKMGEYVFCSTKREKLHAESIGTIFKRLKKRFGWEDVRLSPHTFRHTFSSRVVKAGMDPISLQRMLRHESLAMTNRYVNMWGTQLKEQNEKFNPLNKLDI
jgi:integrase/recombinase XerD